MDVILFLFEPTWLALITFGKSVWPPAIVLMICLWAYIDDYDNLVILPPVCLFLALTAVYQHAAAASQDSAFGAFLLTVAMLVANVLVYLACGIAWTQLYERILGGEKASSQECIQAAENGLPSPDSPTILANVCLWPVGILFGIILACCGAVSVIWRSARWLAGWLCYANRGIASKPQ